MGQIGNRVKGCRVLPISASNPSTRAAIGPSALTTWARTPAGRVCAGACDPAVQEQNPGSPSGRTAWPLATACWVTVAFIRSLADTAPQDLVAGIEVGEHHEVHGR